MDEVIRRFRVYGKVQGVFFRHSTRLEAARLLIHGNARNMPDGTVEVTARGKAPALEELRAWLQHGPPQAQVTEVRESAPDDAAAIPEGFHIF